MLRIRPAPHRVSDDTSALLVPTTFQYLTAAPEPAAPFLLTLSSSFLLLAPTRRSRPTRG